MIPEPRSDGTYGCLVILVAMIISTFTIGCAVTSAKSSGEPSVVVTERCNSGCWDVSVDWPDKVATFNIKSNLTADTRIEIMIESPGMDIMIINTVKDEQGGDQPIIIKALSKYSLSVELPEGLEGFTYTIRSNGQQ